MKSIYFVFIVGFCCSLLFSCDKEKSNLSEPQKDEFLKLYGTSQLQTPVRMLALSNGSYAMLSTTQSPLKGTDISVRFVDNFGNEYNEVLLGDSLNELAGDMIITSDGDLVVVGTTEFKTDSTDVFVARLSTEGVVEYEVSRPHSSNQMGNSIAEMESGSFMIVGSTTEFRKANPDNPNDGENLEGMKDVLIELFNRDETLQFYDRNRRGGSADDEGLKVITAENNSYFIAGNEQSWVVQNGLQNVFWLRVDKVGDEISNGVYPFNESASLSDMIINKRQELLLCGNIQGATSQSFLINVSKSDISNVNWVWQASNAVDNHSLGLYELEDNNYDLCGYLINGDGNKDINIITVTDGGEKLKTETIYGEGDEYAKNIFSFSSGQSLIFGSSSFQGNDMLSLTKTASSE